ncbi:MAG: SH3 domain-containing protein [Candidatus Eisenbacteria bacterium]
MRTLSIIMLGLVVFGSALCSLAGAADAEPQVKVTASRLNVRESPGTDARVLASVARGEILARLDEQPGWVKVRASDGTVGWVSEAYVESFAPTDAGQSETAAPGTTIPQLEPERDSSPGHGGSLGGKLLKWGCLAGAGVFGYLAYDEHAAGNDSYEEYKTLARSGDGDAAEDMFTQAEDHDGKAQTYMIVAGALAGAYLVQEFFLGADADDRAALDWKAPVRFGWDPARHEVRAALDFMRF